MYVLRVSRELFIQSASHLVGALPGIQGNELLKFGAAWTCNTSNINKLEINKRTVSYSALQQWVGHLASATACLGQSCTTLP